MKGGKSEFIYQVDEDWEFATGFRTLETSELDKNSVFMNDPSKSLRIGWRLNKVKK